MICVMFVLAFLTLTLAGCAGGGPFLVHCKDGDLVFGPDIQTDRAIEPGYCP
jgi:hypothetical protein